MDAAKRVAFIKQSAALIKQVEGQTPKGTASKSFTKRKQQEKSDRLPKIPKTIIGPVVGLEAEPKKTVTTLGHGKGRGYMKGPTSLLKNHLSSSMRI